MATTRKVWAPSKRPVKAERVVVFVPASTPIDKYNLSGSKEVDGDDRVG